MKKKSILIIAILGIFILTGGIFAYFKFTKKPTEEPKTGEPVVTHVETINDLEVEQRPYVTLVPREDGKELFLTVDNLKLGETNAEYELEYQTGTMIQGVFGRINFEEEKPPVSKKLLLGSCSKGKCKYDENVSGGTLTLRFSGEKDYVLREDFTLNLMSEKEGLFTSRNAKVSLKIDKGVLSPDAYVVVMSTFGLPAEVEGEVIAGPVGFFTNSSLLRPLKGDLTFKGVEETKELLKVLGLEEGKWRPYGDMGIGDDWVGANVDSLTTFVVIKQQS